MLRDFIEERYGNVVHESTPWRYAFYLCDKGYFTYTFPFGFFTAKLEGDALILRDMYIPPEARKHGNAWKLFEKVKDLAQTAGKVVIITFTQFGGQNQHDGHGAANAAGFKPAFLTKNELVYIRGVQ